MAGRRVSLPPLAPAAASAGVVDVLTGAEPVVPPVPAGPLSEHDARLLTDRIRATAREVADRLVRLRVLVEQARAGQAWVALGYASWTAYLAETLEPMRLPRDERREVVGYLTEQGMSTRAIAPVVSADPKTVVNDRRAIAAVTGGESSTPAVVTGRDGRTYQATSERRPTLVVVPPPPALVDDRERRIRGAAARALHAERTDRLQAVLRPKVGPWHAVATLERARDCLARDAARSLAHGHDDAARLDAAAFLLLDERYRRAYARTADRERLGHPVANTKAG